MIPVAILALALGHGHFIHEAAIELFTVCLLFPLLLGLGLLIEPPPVLAGVFSYFGDISYAVYALHVAVLTVMSYMISKLGLSMAEGGTLFIVFVVGAATIAVHAIDAPLRKEISRRLALRNSAIPVTL